MSPTLRNHSSWLWIHKMTQRIPKKKARCKMKSHNLPNRKFWKRRVLENPWDPSYQFLKILNMEPISSNKHEMEVWYCLGERKPFHASVERGIWIPRSVVSERGIDRGAWNWAWCAELIVELVSDILFGWLVLCSTNYQHFLLIVYTCCELMLVALCLMLATSRFRGCRQRLFTKVWQVMVWQVY